MNVTAPTPAHERVLARTDTVGDCWVFTGADQGGGYGQVSTGTHAHRTRDLAHRVVYKALIGPIPEGHELHHACENKRCVNPDHLELVLSTSHRRQHHRHEMCSKGHSMADAYTTPTGDRSCRTCNRERNHRWHMEHAPRCR